jgi:predicted kinase
MIIIITGLPGSGKSYFAQALADRLKAVYLNSDSIRNAEGARGQYSDDEKLRIYYIMRDRTSENVLAGSDVVVDGTFYLNVMIALFRTVAITLETPIYFISVVADENLIRERLSRPRKDSEADYEVYLRIKKQLEPLMAPHITIESRENNIDEMIATALGYIRRSG